MTRIDRIVSFEYLRHILNMLRDRFGILRIDCFEHFEHFEHSEHFEFLALGAFASGLGLNAFESCFSGFK